VILVDTSAWIEFQRATGSAAHHRLATAIEVDEGLATTGIVMLELLAGARDEGQARALERLLGRCEQLQLSEPFDYQTAARLYRECRSHGKTVRRLPDCLVAAVAIRTDCALLHRDADFEAIALHSTLRTVELAG
jgi:predicted nucleic acid-binding protein